MSKKRPIFNYFQERKYLDEEDFGAFAKQGLLVKEDESGYIVLTGRAMCSKNEFENKKNQLIAILHSKFCLTLKQRKIHLFSSNEKFKGDICQYRYTDTDEVYCRLYWYEQNENVILGLILASILEPDVFEVKNWIEKNFSQTIFETSIDEGTIFLVRKKMGELNLIQFDGAIKTEFIEQNYSEEVKESRKFIIENISKTTPTGKIVIIQGSPGTGKTYFVKSIISEIKNCQMVLLSANQIEEMSGPDGISLLSDNIVSSMPTIFVIEDADEILSKRTGANMSSISSLLNLGDGILGSLFDTRIICTTNTEIKEFDSAIVRPGRLLKLLKVDKLNSEEAKECFENIVKEEVSWNDWGLINGQTELSLAEIYNIANKYIQKKY